MLAGEGRWAVTGRRGSVGAGIRLPVRLVAALLAGLALGAAFPPIGLSWLAPFAPAALTWLCLGVRARVGALIGFCFGLGYFGLLLNWLRLVGVDGWLAVVAIESLFFVALGAALTQVTRLRWWPLAASAAWIAIEYARSSFPFGGFPWGRVAGALAGTPVAPLAWLGGVAFVSFVTVAAGHLLLWLLVRRRSRRARWVVGVSVPAMLLIGWVMPLASFDDPTEEGTATVAVVQGDVPGTGLTPLGEARTVTRNHLAATEELMADVGRGVFDEPDFVLWPENATDIDPFSDAETRATVEEAVEVAGVPILVGAVRDGDPAETFRRTSGIVWDPDTGPGKVYDKRQPVPFGEYIPFREQLLPYIDRLRMVGRETQAGTVPGRLQIAGVKVGLVICFEIAYDRIVTDVATDDTELLVVQSNNASWQNTGMPDQQWAITRMRAIEYGRATLVATPSGISGVIGPDGAVIDESEEGTREVFVEQVPKRTGSTPAAVVGGPVELGLVALGLVGLGVAVYPRIRSRRSGGRGGDAGSGGPADRSGSDEKAGAGRPGSRG